jgi:hypothetical protein
MLQRYCTYFEAQFGNLVLTPTQLIPTFDQVKAGQLPQFRSLNEIWNLPGQPRIIVNWPRCVREGQEGNVAVLAKFRRALKPGGTLVLSDFIVEDDRSGPPFALVFASTMLLTTRQGTTCRRVDYQSWLTEAGIDDVRSSPHGHRQLC